MNLNFDTEAFISSNITHRTSSLLSEDLNKHKLILQKEIKGKSVLVIGGAGTIGASFVKAVLNYLPVKVVVVDINENGLTELVRDCRSQYHIQIPADFRTYPISYADIVFKKLFESEAPFDIVANFAAHKHVRSEKDMYSIEAMVRNNVIEAKKFLDMLVAKPPKHFFCVSTDKAANPVNVMGASKKLMEEVVLAYSTVFKVTTARFANVAFSNGSLLAGFIERLLKKQPLSSPTDVKRYFISPVESGQLCLLACIVAPSGSVVFPVLDPNDDLKSFSEIAEIFLNKLQLIPAICQSETEAKEKATRVSFKSNKDYPVYFFESDTSGEKSFEEFYTENEILDYNLFNKLGRVTNARVMSSENVEKTIGSLVEIFNRNGTKEELVALLAGAIPNFHHIEKAKNLDQKM